MEKKLQNFSQQCLSFVRFWRNVYWSALVPRNLPCHEKFLVASLREEITLKSMSQKKGNVAPLFSVDLWMLWRCHGIPRVDCCYFCLEPAVRKETWMKTTFVTVVVILFESSILKVTGTQPYSKFLLKNYKPHWKQYFERYSTVE